MRFCIGSKSIIISPRSDIVIRVAIHFIHLLRPWQFLWHPPLFLPIYNHTLLLCGYSLRVISWRIGLLPTDISYEALFSKYLVAHFYKVICLSVINRDKYHSVIRQQVPCHF